MLLATSYKTADGVIHHHVDGVRRLWTAATNVPIVYVPGDIWAWKATEGWYRQGKLLIRPAEPSGSKSGGTGRRKVWILSTKYFFHTSKGSLTCRKILRHGDEGFTSSPKKSVRSSIALKNPPSRSGLNPRNLGSMASTLNTRPPEWPLIELQELLFEPTCSVRMTWALRPRARYLFLVLSSLDNSGVFFFFGFEVVSHAFLLFFVRVFHSIDTVGSSPTLVTTNIKKQSDYEHFNFPVRAPWTEFTLI
jgi:hypothetical protein